MEFKYCSRQFSCICVKIPNKYYYKNIFLMVSQLREIILTIIVPWENDNISIYWVIKQELMLCFHWYDIYRYISMLHSTMCGITWKGKITNKVQNRDSWAHNLWLSPICLIEFRYSVFNSQSPSPLPLKKKKRVQIEGSKMRVRCVLEWSVKWGAKLTNFEVVRCDSRIFHALLLLKQKL